MSDWRRATTLREVAGLAGVSVTTASRVLAQRGDYRAETRARVAQAADILEYSRERTKRGSRRSGPTSVELVVGHVSGCWTDRVVRGAWRGATHRGLDLMLSMERFDGADDWVERVAGRRSLGVILGLLRPTQAQLARLELAQLPIVMLDPFTDVRKGVPSVGTTDWAGGYAAAEHLVAQGAEELIVVLAQPAYRFGRAREAGFRAAAAQLAPRSTVTTVHTNWDAFGPVDTLTPLLVGRSETIGVFACNDDIALRCYESAARVGAIVGDDVLVVGFDDEPRAATADPPLTTLHQPIEAMAAHAVAALSDPGSSRREELPTRLVVRGSTTGRGPSVLGRGTPADRDAPRD